MANIKKPRKEVRGQRIAILLTIDELRDVDLRAKEAGVDRSRIFRDAVWPVGVGQTRRDA